MNGALCDTFMLFKHMYVRLLSSGRCCLIYLRIEFVHSLTGFMNSMAGFFAPRGISGCFYRVFLLSVLSVNMLRKVQC